MPRCGDPARVYQAQRAGTVRRLVTEERLDRFDAEQCVAAWERHAADAELMFEGGAFLDAAWEWITESRRKR
jgi:hypothetical protein